MKREYSPSPIDTSGISLPEKLTELTELLARNTHEVWAQGRIAEGWKYGPERNDSLRLHPGLVSYEELPESEKEYDRNTSIETLKAIISLGFDIAVINA